MKKKLLTEVGTRSGYSTRCGKTIVLFRSFPNDKAPRNCSI